MSNSTERKTNTAAESAAAASAYTSPATPERRCLSCYDYEPFDDCRADQCAKAQTINQCDGCARGLPIRQSLMFSRGARELGAQDAPIHYDPVSGTAVMGCTKDRYAASETQEKPK